MSSRDASGAVDDHSPDRRANERPGQPLAVVIGAGGMAIAIARRLGDSYRILLADRDRDHLDGQLARLLDEGHDAIGQVCDVGKRADVTALAERARREGQVRAIAHVVGLSPSMADASTILSVNLVGPALVTEAFQQIVTQGTAAVIVSSVAAHLTVLEPALIDSIRNPFAMDLIERVEGVAGPNFTPQLAYQLSKFGVIELCRRLVSTWGARGARIVSVSPGLIASPQGAFESEARPEKRQLIKATPLAREGTLVEVADVVEFLLSDRASFVSGTDLLVDGGLAAAATRTV